MINSFEKSGSEREWLFSSFEIYGFLGRRVFVPPPFLLSSLTREWELYPPQIFIANFLNGSEKEEVDTDCELSFLLCSGG